MLGNGASGTAATAQSLRRLIVPALAATMGVAVLVSLGTWQLQRRAWKLDLIEKIEARAYGTPGALPPEAEWARWSSARRGIPARARERALPARA